MATVTHLPVADSNGYLIVPIKIPGGVGQTQRCSVYNPATNRVSTVPVHWVPTPVPFEATLAFVESNTHGNEVVLAQDVNTRIHYVLPFHVAKDILFKGYVIGGVVRGMWQAVKNRNGYTIELIQALPPSTEDKDENG